MHPFYYSLGSFGILEFIGDLWPGYIANHFCFPVLGCNVGFFGYDGLIHLFSGICVGLGLLWAQQHSFIRPPSLRSFLGWGALVALGWEFLESGYDVFRIVVLDMNLFYPNILTQPNSIDTAGDIALGLGGTIAAYLLLADVPGRKPYGAAEDSLAQEI